MELFTKLQVGLTFHFHIYKLQVDLSVPVLCRKCQFYKQFYKVHALENKQTLKRLYESSQSCARPSIGKKKRVNYISNVDVIT